MANGQEEVISYTPAKKKKEEKEEVLSYTPAQTKTAKALSELNFSAMPGMMPGKIPGNPDIIRDTLSGMGRDLKRSFSKENPMIGPAVNEFKSDPTKVITGAPQAIFSTAGDILGGIAGLVSQFSQAMPRIAAGQNILDAIAEGKEDREKISSAPRKFIESGTGQKAESSQAVINTIMSPFTGALNTVDMAVSEGAKLITKDEKKREGIRSIGQVAALLALGRIARGMKGSALEKSAIDKTDKLFDRLKTEPPIGEDVTAGVKIPEPAPDYFSGDVGATYGEGGTVIGGVKVPPNVKPTVGPSTGKAPSPFFRLAEQNIKRISPGLHNRLQRYRFERDSRSGQMMSQLSMVDHIFEKVMSEKTKGLDNVARDQVIHTRIADIVEGRLKPENALEEMGANIYKNMMDGVTQEIARLSEQGEKFTVRGPWGERSWSPVEGYYPRVYSNLAELLESPAASGVRTREVIGNSLAKRMYPEKYANPATRAAAIEDALGVAKNFTSKTATKKYGHLESSRLLQPEDVMELENEGILKREYNSGVIHDYINKVQDRLAWTRNFGTDVVWNGQKIPRAWAEGLSSVKGNQLAESFLKKSLERATGSRDVNAWTKLSDALNVVQTPKMIMSSAANMNQWLANSVPLQPVGDIPQTVFDTMRKIMGDKSLDKFYRESGIQITPERILSKIEDDPNTFLKAQKAFYKAIGFTETEGVNSFYGGMAGANKALSISRKLYLKPEAWRSGAWEKQLKMLGVDDLSIAEIKSGKRVGPRNMEELQRAAWEVKQLSQFANDMWGKPLSFSNPNAKLMTKFKGFPISQLQKFAVDGVFQPAIEFVSTGGRTGDIGPLIKAPITMGIAGAMTTGVKHLVWSSLGKKDMYDKYIQNKPFLQQWAYFISQAGSLGIATDFATATSADRLLTSVLGPTLSDAKTITEGLFKLRKEVIDPAWKTKSTRLIADRRYKIIKVLADTTSKMQPAVRMALAKFWPSYMAAKDLNSWENIYARESQNYKDLLEYGDPGVADEYWDRLMDTWGEEYMEITGKFPDKPTIEETISYQENKKK